MHCKVEKIGVDPLTLSSEELCSVDVAPLKQIQKKLQKSCIVTGEADVRTK